MGVNFPSIRYIVNFGQQEVFLNSTKNLVELAEMVYKAMQELFIMANNCHIVKKLLKTL